MVKIPRDISARRLCGILEKFDYSVVRQTGSHIRLRSEYKRSAHFITIPEHDPIKIGTLNKILNEVAGYLEISKEELLRDLF